MSILTQIWNNSEINFASENLKIAKFDIPKGYVNATQICKANKKELKHWKENKRSKAFTEALSVSVGIPTDLLIVEINDGLNSNRGTWVHPRIGINIGQWISPEFDVWVATQIDTLMTSGSVSLVEAIQTPQTYLEALKALVASEEAKELLLIENQQLLNEVEQLSEIVDELFDYSSIIRVAKFNNISENDFEWRKLKAASTAKNLEIKKAPCPRYGTKNLYHHDVWRFIYPKYKLPETVTLTISK